MGNFLIRHYRSLFAILLIVMLFLAFLLGFLTGKSRQAPSVVLSCSPDVLQTLTIPVASLSHNAITREGSVVAKKPSTGTFVGSKNGTKYYTPGCSGTKRINPENYVWFSTVQDAQLQGYTKGSC